MFNINVGIAECQSEVSGLGLGGLHVEALQP